MAAKLRLKMQYTPEQAKKLSDLRALTKQVDEALGVEGKLILGSEHEGIIRIPTKILGLDVIMGGGLPRGNMVEFHGPESSAKSTLVMACVKAIQATGEPVLWIKGEGFDKPWMVKNGVNMDLIYLVEASSGDKVLEAAITVLGSGLLGGLVIDSVQSLATAREMTDSVEQESYAGAGSGQMWGRVMRKAYAYANSDRARNTCFITISQVRDKIGSFGKVKPAPQPTGIRSIRHWKSIAIECKPGEPFFINADIEERKLMYAREFHLRCRKNKTAIPERTATIRYYLRKHEGIPVGVDVADQIFRYAKAYGILEISGSWYSCEGIRVQGKEKFLLELRKNKKYMDKLYRKIMYLVEKEAEG